MKRIILRLLILVCVVVVLISCGKVKDKADTFEVSVIHPNGQDQGPLPHGVSVKVYANGGQLYLQGETNITNEEALGATSILFTPEDRLPGEFGDNTRIEDLEYVIVTLGDSISNMDGTGKFSNTQVYLNKNFEDKKTNNEVHWAGTYYSYYGLLTESSWILSTAYLNGTEGTPIDCALDNTLSFSGENISSPLFDEGADVCNSSSANITFNTPLNFQNGTINGSSCKYNNASGFITIDSQTATVSRVSLIYPDTLIITSSLDNNTVDYYYAKQ